jgi:hypothetical protein
MAAIRPGNVNTTWKYGTSSSSDLRCFIHASACGPWHLGQCLLRQVMGVAHYLPYGQIH